jgi:hypothetical protein
MIKRVKVKSGWMVMHCLAISMLFFADSFAGEIKVSWKENQEFDLSGYRIYYGIRSKGYDQMIDVGKVTSFVISGLQDNVEYFFALTAYDTDANESAFSAEVSGVLGDSQPPDIADVSPITLNVINIVFNEKVEKGSAENAGNYIIDNGIEVKSASLLSDRKTVQLETSAHAPDKDYTLTVNGIYDIAIPPNPIAADTRISYTVSDLDQDTTPPTLRLANLVTSTQLNVYFSEPVEQTSATKAENYLVNNGIKVNSAEMGSNANVVILHTSEHANGVMYTLTVRNVTDNSENKNLIPDNSTYTYSWEPGDMIGPLISLVNVMDDRTIDVLFNEPLEKASAEQVGNYAISGGIQVLSARLDESRQIVRLQTTTHQPDMIYLLTINGVRDASANHNPVAAKTSYSYAYEPLDETGPTIIRVELRDESHLRIFFSEILDRDSAGDIENYTIDNGIQVLQAVPDVTGQVVDLETTTHTAGTIYLLVVNHIKDASSAGNEILPNSSYTYVYQGDNATTGPTIVEAVARNATTLALLFSKQLDIESAQNKVNYSLNNGASVLAAEVDASGQTVVLQTTTLQPGQVYTIRVSGVRDLQGNAVPANSMFNFIYQANDAVGPLITLVQLRDAENIDILFNERLDLSTAEDKSNYSISGNIQISSARLDGSRRVVQLQTTPHEPNKLYILRVSNVLDESPCKNQITANSSYAYTYEPADQLPPRLAMVNVISADRLSVTFSEQVDPNTALNKNCYCLNNDLVVNAVYPGAADNMVELQVSPLVPGNIYLLIVNDVVDLAGNELPPNSAYIFTYGRLDLANSPKVVAVKPVNAQEIEITFNAQVDRASAENINNYQIQNDIKVLGATLDDSFTKVRLTTSAHSDEKIYVLMVRNIGRFDDPLITVTENSPFYYVYRENSVAQLVLEGAKVYNDNVLKLTFSRQADRLSAENKSHYRISGNVTVLNATLGESGRDIFLETSRHRPGLAYTIQVSGIKSQQSADDAAELTATIAYTYLPALQVEVKSDAETLLSFADIGREYYLDRNYVITYLPDFLQMARMIMTANGDRSVSATRFLTLSLSHAAFIYVAYDTRAVSVPNWLDVAFTKTDATIGVSESAEVLALWQGYFEAGDVILGGNNAIGAQGVKSMYVVFIQEPSMASQPGGGGLEGSYGNGNKLPTQVQLLPNYPNPFNPTTTIAFDLPFDKSVKLEIYNILGRLVKTLYDGQARAGRHAFVWSGDNEEGQTVAAGIYLYRLEAWEYTERNGFPYRENYIATTGKMTLIK